MERASARKPSNFSDSDSSSLAPGKSASVKAGQDLSMIASCWGSPPSFLSSYISASGTDTTNFAAVSSPYKTFIVQGDRPYVMSECPQTCPPATDTPRTPPATDTTSPPATDNPSIVFVHGFQPSSVAGKNTGQDCIKYWGDAIKFLAERGLTDLRTVKYYNGDVNCKNGKDEGTYSSDLHHPLYASLCKDFHPGYQGSDGTNDESIYHLSCLFAQYLNYNFGRGAHKEVVLVGHSMGGMIMQETLFQVQTHTDQFPFPSNVGSVTKAITFNSPHAGTVSTVPFTDIPIIGSFPYAGDKQVSELTTGSALTNELATSGRNPQTAGGFTEWTAIGSQCDIVVQPASSSYRC